MPNLADEAQLDISSSRITQSIQTVSIEIDAKYQDVTLKLSWLPHPSSFDKTTVLAIYHVVPQLLLLRNRDVQCVIPSGGHAQLFMVS